MRTGDGWEVGKLGNWEIGRLGGWEIGRLGNWEKPKNVKGKKQLGEVTKKKSANPENPCYLSISFNAVYAGRTFVSGNPGE